MKTKVLSPLRQGQKISVSVPGSKSLTNRVLLLAALAKGKTALHHPLRSEDTEHMATALRQIGFQVETENDAVWTIEGQPRTGLQEEFFLGNAGTATRFLTAYAGLLGGEIRITGKPRMQERPIGDLLDALRQLGVDLISEQNNDCPPLRIHGTSQISGGRCSISGATSSQFLSALLLVGARMQKGLTLQIHPPLVSRPYLEMTIDLLKSFGLEVEEKDAYHYHIPPQEILGKTVDIEADASSAMHIFSLALSTKSRVTIKNFVEDSLQGDARFLQVLEHFGATITGKTVSFDREALNALGNIDLEDMPDAALNAIALAALAPGKTHITGLQTLRDKECDRIEVMASNLRNMGAEVETFSDAITIHGDPKKLHGSSIATHDDHRIAMSFAVLGATVPGVIIEDPDCVGKTFPNFWEIYDSFVAA